MASVSVQIVPDATGLRARMKALIEPIAVKVGEETGRSFGRVFGQEAASKATEAIQRGLRAARPQYVALGKQSGAVFGIAFGSEARNRIEAALRHIDVGLDVDTAGTRARIEAALSGFAVNINLDVDPTAVRAQIIGALAGIRADVRVGMDESAARARLAVLIGEIRGPHDMNVRLDTAAARAQLATIGLGTTVSMRIDVDTRVAAAEIALLIKLIRGPHTMRIDIDTAVAAAEFAALIAAMRAGILGLPPLPGGGPIPGGGGGGPSGMLGMLANPKVLAALAAVAGTLVQIAGAALAAGAGLAALGVSGGIAIAGIVKAYKDGTVLGFKFQTAVKGIRDSFDGLAASAAVAAGPGLLDALGKVNALVPQITPQVDRLAASFGRIVSSVAGGLVGGIKTFGPVFDQVAAGAEKAASAFEKWATGAGGVAFARSLQDSLTRVVPLLASVGRATSATVAAFAEIGKTTTPMFTVLFDFVGQFADHMNRGFKAIGPILRPIVGLFQDIGKFIGKGIDLSNTLVDSLEPLIGVIGKVGSAIEKAFGWTFEKMGSGFDLFGRVLSGEIVGLVEPTKKLGTELFAMIPDEIAAKAAALATSLASVRTELGLSEEQGKQFAAMVGLTDAKIRDSADGIGMYRDALDRIAQGYAQGNTAVGGYLDALDTFTQSTRTAGDTAAYLGASLLLANGDMLDFLGSQTGTSDAMRALVASFDDSTRAAVNWGTGMIDATQKGATPLIQGLQGIRDAALESVQGLYRHELGLQDHALSAEEDSALIGRMAEKYRAFTSGALAENAAALGITAEQAQKLADVVFPFDGKKFDAAIKIVGLDTINDTLIKIGEQLALLTGTPFTAILDADTTPFYARANEARAEMGAIAEKVTKPIIDADNAPALAKSQFTTEQLAALAAKGTVPVIDANNDPATQVIGDTLSRLLATHNTKTNPTITANASPANAAIDGVRNNLNSIHDKSINVGVNAIGWGQLGGLWAQLNSLQDKTVTVTTQTKALQIFATGGLVGGSGTRDTVPAMLTPGEWVSTPSSARRNAAALAAGNRGAQLVAVPPAGDAVPSYRPGPPMAPPSTSSSGGGPAVAHFYDVDGVLIGTIRGEVQRGHNDVARDLINRTGRRS